MRVAISMLIFFLLSCQNNDPVSQIPVLSGYWHIESVQMPNGNTREFGMTTVIDFIELTDSIGIRKKVTPQLDGSYLVNKSAEKFELKIEEDSLRLYYRTPFDSWKETVLSAKDSTLSIRNNEGKVYNYKRFQKINILNE